MKTVFTIFSILSLTFGSLNAAELNPVTTDNYTIAGAGSAADGDHEIKWSSGSEGIFEIAGTFGGGTLKVYRHQGDPTDPSNRTLGTWVQVDLNRDGTIDAGDDITAAYEFVLITGGNWIQFKLSGSTDPDIDIRAEPTRLPR
jgi:hypothetical protein